jgi:hypothetical protein
MEYGFKKSRNENGPILNKSWNGRVGVYEQDSWLGAKLPGPVLAHVEDHGVRRRAAA